MWDLSLALMLQFVLVMLPAPGFAQRWLEVTPELGPAPPARTQAASVYDPVEHQVVLFGGRGDSGALNDVWVLDLEEMRWTDVTPFEGASPPPRFTPAGVYDDVGRQMVIWSGQGAGFLNDVWALDLSDFTWSEINPITAAPNIRYGVAAVLDPRTRSLVTFAGFTDQGRFDDTWIFDLENGEWTEVTPANGPMRRCLHTAGYDAREHRMIMYGGQRSGPLDDIWAFNLTAHTWSELTQAAERPEGRYFAAGVYDVRNHRMLVFGGNRGALGRTNEVWSFDLTENAWNQVEAAGTQPADRDGAAAVYIEAEDRVIVFGGRGSTLLDDVWSLELESSTTASETEAGTLSGRPDNAELHGGYPNPFHPGGTNTTIRYSIGNAGSVNLSVFDLLGRRIAVLVDGVQPVGMHEVIWDGRDADGKPLPPGIYVYRLSFRGRRSAARTIILGN